METQYQELDEFHADPRQEGQDVNDDDFWRRLAIDLLRAGLLAAVGVVVRELVRRIEGREPRTYDAYGGY